MNASNWLIQFGEHQLWRSSAGGMLLLFGLLVCPPLVSRAAPQPGNVEEEQKRPAASEQNHEAEARRGESSAAVDLYGDPLPDGAAIRLGTIRYRHPGLQKRMSLVPHRETILIGTPSGTLRFCDARSGRLTREITVGAASLQSFDVSSSGQTVATLASQRLGEGRSYSAQLMLWEAESGDLKSVIYWMEPLAEQSVCVAFTPVRDMIVTGTRHGKIRVWDIASEKELSNHSVVDRGGVEAIAFSPDGEPAAVASRAGVFLWDWLSDREPQKLQDLDRGARSVAFSPDGKWLATGSDDEIGCRLFDGRSGRLVRRLQGASNRGYPEGIAFDPDGQQIAVPTYESGIELWDVNRGELVKSFDSQNLSMRGVAISSDGKLLVGMSSGSVVKAWDLATGDSFDEKFVGHNEYPNEIEFMADGKKVITSDNTGKILLWDAGSGKPLQAMAHRMVSALNASPDGTYAVSAGHDDTVRLWETSTGREVFKLYGHGRIGGAYKLAVAPDSQTFVSFGPDMYLRTFDRRTGKALTEHAIRPSGIAIQEDEDNNVQFDSDPFGGIGGPMIAAGQSRLSDDGKLLLLPHQNEIYVFDVQTGQEIRKFAPGDAAFDQFALSPDGKRLVTISLERAIPNEIPGHPQNRISGLRIIDFETNEVLFHRELDGHYFRGVHFSPDGSHFAMSGYRYLQAREREQWTSVWSIEPAEEYARIPSEAISIAFSPDNQRLATSHSDTSVIIWNLNHFASKRLSQ